MPPAFHGAKQSERQHERKEMIQEAEHQQRRDQRLLVVATEPDQDRRIEHAEPGRRVAGKTQQRRYDENRRKRKYPDIR